MNRFKIASVTIAIILVTQVAIQLATAQSVQEWRSASESDQPKFKLVQAYHGTTPGTGNTLPKVEELKGVNGSWITWPGFLMKQDGGSRIFLQTTAPVEYKQTKRKRKVTLTFKETKIFLSNNQNPLVTLHFNTPLRKAFLKKSRKHAELVLELKVDAEVSVMQVSIEDGYSYLFIDFPPGKYPVGGDYGKRPAFGSDDIGPTDANDNSEIPPEDGLQVTDDESPF